MKFVKPIALAAPLLVIAGSLVAFSPAADDDDEGVRAGITIDVALQNALGVVSGFAKHAETEKEGSKVQWCVVIVTPENKIFEVELDGANGNVLESEEEDDEGPAMTAPVGMAQAVAKAVGTKPGYVTEAELENEDNRLTWGVEVIATSDGKLWEVEMDANTGAVLSVTLEDDDNGGGG
jgi:uncharacterized membrane protein YkoI